VLCAAVGLLVGAVGAPHAAAGEASGLVRIAHLSPDTPAVDVALAPLPASGSAPLTDPGPDVATGLGYGDVSAFAAVPPGSYAVSVRAAGSPSSTPPALTTRIDVPGGAARTVAISGHFAELALHLLPEDLSAPPDGAARVRVLSAAAGAPSVDVRLDGGPALATALPFGGSGSPVDVPAGAATVVLDGSAPLPLRWAPGSISTLLVLDAPGGLTVRVVLDAAGPAVVPTGAVEAGGGGTAGSTAALPWALGAATALAMSLAMTLIAASRRGRMLAVVAVVAVVGVAAAPSGTASTLSRPVREIPLSSASPVPAGVPVRLQVPSAGIDTALQGIDVDAAGALAPPSDDTLAGWYRQGPAPGETGPAVLTGHVDGASGPAAFFGLRDAAAGDLVTVARGDGTTVRFTVTRVARYPKGSFPTAEVYAPTPGAELRLITCGGTFDRAARSYRDNVVVYARLG
jgi:hypothetical protein